MARQTAGPSLIPGAAYALGVLTFINFINYLDRYLVPGALTRIEDGLGIDHAQAGGLQTAFIVVYTAAAPLGGYIGDRYPRRFVLAGSIFLWSLATLGSGLAWSFASLLFARGLVGVGEAGYGIVSPGLIADFYPPSRRTRALSIFYVAIPVGSALGYVLGGWLANAFSWQTAFFVGAVPGMIAAVLALRVREPHRGASEAVEPTQKTLPMAQGLRELRHNSYYWVSVAGLTLMTFSIGGLSVYMPAFLERERGVTGAQAGIWFGAIAAVAGLTGTLVGGVLGDRAEQKSRTGGLWVSGIGMLLAAPFMVLDRPGRIDAGHPRRGVRGDVPGVPEQRPAEQRHRERGATALPELRRGAERARLPPARRRHLAADHRQDRRPFQPGDGHRPQCHPGRGGRARAHGRRPAAARPASEQGRSLNDSHAACCVGGPGSGTPGPG